MAEKDLLLQIDDLYVNFYTRMGVVKALDGVSLSLKRGETFGLVGETGCGKSVTANSILRLLPSPPSKTEKGRIIFIPKELAQRLELLDADLKAAEAAGDEQKRQEVVKQRDALMDNWDLLKRSKDFIQKIRGNYISMIFQEPMAALNPVFPAGEQIAEVYLLHQRKDLAASALKEMENEYTDLKRKRVSAGENVKGERICESCGTPADPEATYCKGCNGSFNPEPLRLLKLIPLKYNMTIYRGIVKNENHWLIRFASRVPGVRRFTKNMKKQALKRAEQMLKLVRIPDPGNVIKSYPHELSGGMQQRVMIAMALACRPQLLIADEPTTALDVTIQAQILKLMRDLQEEMGTSVLLITHNLGVVAETCERVGIMYAGVMVEVGPVRTVFKAPSHPYTRGLMNSIPRLNSESERLETISGSVPNLIKPPPGCRFNPRCPMAMEDCAKEAPKMVEVEQGHFVSCHLFKEGEA